MPTTQRRRRRMPPEVRRRQILDAARRVFAERGYEAAGVPDIAAAAELAVGSVYRFFPSKADLYLELLVAGHAELAGHLDRAARSVPANADPATQAADRSAAVVDALLDFLAGRDDLLEVMLFATRVGPDDGVAAPETLARLAEAEARPRGILADALADSESVTAHRREPVTAAVWGMLLGVAARARRAENPHALAAEARDLLQAALFGDVAYLG